MAATAALQARQPRPRAVLTRVGVLGLGLMAGTGLLFLTLALVKSLDDAGFIAVVTGLSAIAAVLAWRFGTWAKVVGIVVTLLVGMATFWMAFGLSQPASIADFLPGLTMPAGLVLSLVGNIGAIVKGRRGQLAVEATRGERRTELVVAGLVLVAAAVSGGLMLLNRSTVEVPAGATDVGMHNFAFAPGDLSVTSGGTLAVHNGDPFVHDVTIPSLSIHEVVLPGQTVLIPVSGDAGSYTFYCSLHADVNDPDPATAGMAGRITVSS